MADTRGYNPTEVRPGMRVMSKDETYDEIVRNVTVIVHLANGMDERYELSEIVQVVATAPVV